MNFWLRNIILGVLLTALAVAFFLNKDFLLSLDGSLGQVEESAIKPNVTTINTTPQTTSAPAKKSNNAAAVGLSKFYANLYGDTGGKGPKIRNNIVYLPDPQGEIEPLLQARGMVVRPYKDTWRGHIESRRFHTGETLNQKLTEYAEHDGLLLFWWINRDYVIKDPFRIKEDILKTTFKVAKAVEGHFDFGLAIFFCNKQRAIVVIENAPHPFLDKECILLVSDNPY